MKRWYCEYKSHVRIHDYFSFLIGNFPILAVRRYDWGLHEPNQSSTYSFAVLGFSYDRFVENPKWAR